MPPNLLTAAVLWTAIGAAGGFAPPSRPGLQHRRHVPAKTPPIIAFAMTSAPQQQQQQLEPLGAADDDDLAASRTRYFGPEETRPILLFDGVCALCNGFVTFLLDHDAASPRGRLRFAALQSSAGRALLVASGRSPRDHSSMVVVLGEGRSVAKSDAVLAIAETLSWNSPLAETVAKGAAGLVRLVVPKKARDAVMDVVGEHRYGIFGESDECRVSDDRFADRFVQFGDVDYDDVAFLDDDDDDDDEELLGDAHDGGGVVVDPWSPFSVVGGDASWVASYVASLRDDHVDSFDEAHRNDHLRGGPPDAWRGPPDAPTTATEDVADNRETVSI